MTLEKIQQWMQGALLDPYGNDEQTLEQIVRPSKRLAAHQHLAIYQRSYVARLRECMSKQFPALEYALGKRLFTQFDKIRSGVQTLRKDMIFELPTLVGEPDFVKVITLMPGSSKGIEGSNDFFIRGGAADQAARAAPSSKRGRKPWACGRFL